jgi:hypothetical protein
VIFDAVNKNGDDIVCFKPSPNKEDAGVLKRQHRRWPEVLTR